MAFSSNGLVGLPVGASSDRASRQFADYAAANAVEVRLRTARIGSRAAGAAVSPDGVAHFVRSIGMAGIAKASSLGLRRIALLDGLGDACVERIAAACSWRRHEAGRQIVRRDAKDRDVHLLVDGRIRITAYASSGRQVTFRDLDAGDLFGELAAIDGRMRSADVIALDDVLIATLPAQAFRDLLRDEPVVAERLIARLVGEVRRLSDHVIDLSTASVGQRLAAELLRLALRAGVESGAARIAPMPTHAELAAQLGTYREQVTRELSALTRSGVVGKDGRAIVVPDVRRLQAIARRD